MTEQAAGRAVARAPAAGASEAADVVVLPFPDAASLVVLVAGQADAHTAPALRAQLLQALVHRRATLVIDVTELQFCDLRGLDALDDGADAAERVGMVVTFRGMSSRMSWLRANFSRRSSRLPAPAERPSLVLRR